VILKVLQTVGEILRALNVLSPLVNVCLRRHKKPPQCFTSNYLPGCGYKGKCVRIFEYVSTWSYYAFWLEL